MLGRFMLYSWVGLIGNKIRRFMGRTAYYIRVSTVEQNLARQEEKVESDWKVFADKISGTVPFELRPQGQKLLKDVAAGKLDEIKVLHLSRLGRNTENILSTIKTIHEYGVSIHLISQGVHTLINKKENITSKLLITILSGIATADYETRREATLAGILLAKQRGVYKGRSKGSTENIDKWSQKPKVQKVKTLLESGVSVRKIRQTLGVSYNLCYKVKRLLLDDDNDIDTNVYDDLGNQVAFG
jgi:DNA invertase Pin-like site-specific DNA recombinase